MIAMCTSVPYALETGTDTRRMIYKSLSFLVSNCISLFLFFSDVFYFLLSDGRDYYYYYY